MNSFIAFCKKEFLEQIRTYKTLILIAVFFVFGMMSPLLAKIMPEIISDISIKGMKITIDNPSNIDAYTQFFKNISQMGIVTLILVFSGDISLEITKGTLINMLSKGIPRHIIILSKYTSSLVLWTVSYTVAAITNYSYTIYLFGNETVDNVLFSYFCLWLFGALILAIIYITSTFTRGNYGVLLITSVSLGILLVLNMFPNIRRFNPISLATDNISIITNTVSIGDMLVTICIACLAIIFLLGGSLFIFKSKQL